MSESIAFCPKDACINMEYDCIPRWQSLLARHDRFRFRDPRACHRFEKSSTTQTGLICIFTESSVTPSNSKKIRAICAHRSPPNRDKRVSTFSALKCPHLISHALAGHSRLRRTGPISELFVPRRINSGWCRLPMLQAKIELRSRKAIGCNTAVFALTATLSTASSLETFQQTDDVSRLATRTCCSPPHVIQTAT